MLYSTKWDAKLAEVKTQTAPFLSPEVLGISPTAHAALVKVLGMLERGKLHHVRSGDDIIGRGFNLANHRIELACGAVACFAGWADIMARPHRLNLLRTAQQGTALYELLAPPGIDWHAVTPKQAARALGNYLIRYGEPRWSDALAAA